MVNAIAMVADALVPNIYKAIHNRHADPNVKIVSRKSYYPTRIVL